VWGSRAVAGRTAGSGKPPVLPFSIVFGLPELFFPQGVRQISTELELLPVGVQQSGTASVYYRNRPFT
jgi:hypothetical protein